MLTIKALTHLTDCIPTTATEIYISSFPPDERRNTDDLQNIWLNNNHFTYNLILIKNELCGILLNWNFSTFIYLEHFAIQFEFRNNGIGRTALNQWLSEQTLPVILEVEPPSDHISASRINFYERLGFKLWNVDYTQPPYSADKQSIRLLLMSFGDLDVEKSFEQIKRVLHKEVYGVAAK